jgi:hypothetical protein
METVKGQITKVQTTADECVRLTIDCDVALIGNVNVLQWKNQMVKIELEESNDGK